MDRDTAIARIRAALKSRSGKPWSVKGGRGTAWGWITITAPPARRNECNRLQPTDREELRGLFGPEMVDDSGIQIPASDAYYQHWVERAETGATSTTPQPYWD